MNDSDLSLKVIDNTRPLEERIEATQEMLEYVRAGNTISKEALEQTDKAFCQNKALDAELMHLYAATSFTYKTRLYLRNKLC